MTRERGSDPIRPNPTLKSSSHGGTTSKARCVTHVLTAPSSLNSQPQTTQRGVGATSLICGHTRYAARSIEDARLRLVLFAGNLADRLRGSDAFALRSKRARRLPGQPARLRR